MEILAFIFATCVMVPAMWFSRRFFRRLNEENRRQRDIIDEEERRQHWQQIWRR